MFEYILALVLSASPSPWTADDVSPHTLTLQLDARSRSSCRSQRLEVPVSEGGVIYFVADGVQYEGVEAPNGVIVLQTEGDRPLSLSGDQHAGGMWSRGSDGTCSGSWQAVR